MRPQGVTIAGLPAALGSLGHAHCPWGPGGEKPLLGTNAAVPHCSLWEVQGDRVARREATVWPGMGAGIRLWAQSMRDHSVGLTHLWSHLHTHRHSPLIWLEVHSLRLWFSAAQMVTE